MSMSPSLRHASRPDGLRGRRGSCRPRPSGFRTTPRPSSAAPWRRCSLRRWPTSQGPQRSSAPLGARGARPVGTEVGLAQASPTEKASALRLMGRMAIRKGDYGLAASYYSEAMSLLGSLEWSSFPRDRHEFRPRRAIFTAPSG